MQGMGIDQTADAESSSNVIQVDGVLLATGLFGLVFLFGSFVWLLSGVAAAVVFGFDYFVSDRTASLWIGALVGAAICCLLWALTRWIARGILEGKRGQAILACTLLFSFGAMLLWALLQGHIPHQGKIDLVVLALLSLFGSLVLIASFRNRRYWRQRGEGSR